jgi:hypothetical protein
MADTYPHATQRAQLDRFLKSIGARPSTLRRDDCGDPAIKGTRGHVMAIPGIPWHRSRVHEAHKRAGFLLYVVTESGTAWTYAKRALKFAEVTQDGDEEGFLWLDRLPTAEEAKVIRRYLGIPKKAELSEETKAARRTVLAAAREKLAKAA